jgi:hypothetical protein
MHFFHRLSVLERATDHKCIIIAACQKKHQVWEVFQIQRSPKKQAASLAHMVTQWGTICASEGGSEAEVPRLEPQWSGVSAEDDQNFYECKIQAEVVRPNPKAGETRA